MRPNDPFDDPFDDRFEDIFREFERLFEEMGAGGPAFAGSSGRADPEGLAVDVQTDDETLTVVADVPGVDKEAIDLQCDGDVLRIAAVGERREYDEVVDLPARVDPDSAEASFNNGVLEVRFDRAGAGTRIDLS